MGETATIGEAGAAGDLAGLLAEAAANLAGADERLAERLRPDLAAVLNDRLAGAEPMAVVEAGQLVLRHWHGLAGTAGSQAAGGSIAASPGGNGGAPGTGKAAAGAKPRRRGKGQAARPPGAGVLVPPVDDPLFLRYAEEAAGVMQQLVSDALERDAGDDSAPRSLHALAALARLDPLLARMTRLRWFAGLDDSALARLLGMAEPDVRRNGLKARAFLAAASRTTQPA